ncbi:MAG: hypothetical protein P4L79_01725 [Legionella sp.]|uniref:hypothetical protein n=1 Tax=Legionella sp. TaxID=459 RepID=UPI00284FC74C|nr:hypothetical protein [Legionella sp.]
MPFFTVIRKRIKEGFIPEDTANPTQKELLNDLKTYPQVYLFTSLADAQKVAETFFHSPHVPKVGGSYGLVAEVTATFANMPEQTQVDDSVLFNNWVDSQILSYSKREVSGRTYSCIITSQKQIASILMSYIPEMAKNHNPNLQDTDFTVEVKSSLCNVM